MAGLGAVINGAQAHGAAPQQPGQAEQPNFGEEQATPEEQAQYDQIVGNAMNITYDKAMLPRVIQMLEGEGDPIEGLAQTAAVIISRVMQSAQQAGVELDGIVAFHAGTEILEDLAELSKEAEVHDFSQNPDDLETAYFRTLDNVRVMMQESGQIKQQDAQADMQKLQAMDQSGDLEKMLVGLAERDQRGRAPPEEQSQAPAGRGLMQEA